MPARRASSSTASLNSTRSMPMTKSKTLPDLPQDQHLKFCHFGSTCSDGRESLWNGQTALKVLPFGCSVRYPPTTATMSLASLTCLVREDQSAKAHLFRSP